jgi:hypothetical protein
MAQRASLKIRSTWPRRSWPRPSNLKELEGGFGDIGFAAAAYNAMEARVGRYLAGSGRLLRDVLAIADYPAEV